MSLSAARVRAAVEPAQKTYGRPGPAREVSAWPVMILHPMLRLIREKYMSGGELYLRAQ
jgi:hypothetical protein